MMNQILFFRIAAALALAGGLSAGPAAAQDAPLAMHRAEFAAAAGSAARASASDEAMELSRSLARGGYAVVVDLDENLLSFRKGRTTLWSAPIGTGTGLRLETEDQEWDFSTPNGLFHVQYKEENPVWIAPDWYFVENDLPVPPQDDKRRYFPGGLGAAAVYIGRDLAIHGTDKPELLGQRVSHGCIRLADKDAQRLFHNVQIGTEVVIVGGERADEQRRRAAKRAKDPSSTFNPGKPKPRPKDTVLAGWKRMPTGELLWELDEQLWEDPDRTRWTEIASLLLARGLEGDDDALAGLLVGVRDVPTTEVEQEYSTFVADAFHRGALRTLHVLGTLDRDDRERAAAAIVEATVGLHAGEREEAVARSWPTHRVPEATVGRKERLGWNALQRAERELRRDGARSSI